MKRINIILAVLLGALLLGVGAAQTATADPISFLTGKAEALLGGVAAMGTWSAAITGYVRHHWLKTLQGVAVTGLAFVIAFLTTGGLVLATPAAWSIFVIVAFALASAVFASGALAVTFKGPMGAIINALDGFILKYLKGKGIDTTGADQASGGASGNSSGA